MRNFRSKILLGLLGVASASILIAFLNVEPATFGREEREFGAWVTAGAFFSPLVLVGGLLLVIAVASIVIDVRRNRS